MAMTGQGLTTIEANPIQTSDEIEKNRARARMADGKARV
jgi:hypothetical protein